MPSLALAKSRVLANVAGLTTTFFDLVREDLFGSGEQGIYMPSVHESFLRGDLYQDAAGTTPAALGQPVGLWLDRSGNGNHASQSTAASRPTLQKDANGVYVLRFDGVDDWMVTPSVDFTGTDKMTVLAGVYKAGDETRGIVVDAANGGPRAFYIAAPQSNGPLTSYGFGAGTTRVKAATVTGRPAPDVAVLTGTGDLASGGAGVRIRLDGASAGTPATANPGFYGDHPITVGARLGADLPFTGDIYGLIVCGAEKSLAQIERGESLINRYTRAY